MNVELSVVISRPVADVFAYVTDSRYHSQWDSGAKEVRYAPEGKVGVGSKITEVRSFLGRNIESSSEIIEYELNKKMTRRGEKPFPLTGYLTFEPVPGGTKFSWRFEGQPGRFFALAEGLVVGNFKKAIESSMAAIKAHLENGAVVSQV
jgi:hypothetical protein